MSLRLRVLRFHMGLKDLLAFLGRVEVGWQDAAPTDDVGGSYSSFVQVTAYGVCLLPYKLIWG